MPSSPCAYADFSAWSYGTPSADMSPRTSSSTVTELIRTVSQSCSIRPLSIALRQLASIAAVAVIRSATPGSSCTLSRVSATQSTEAQAMDTTGTRPDPALTASSSTSVTSRSSLRSGPVFLRLSVASSSSGASRFARTKSSSSLIAVP